MINSEFVSRIMSQLRLENKDSYISKRAILFTGWSIAEKFLSQKIKNKSLHRNQNMFKEIPCIEFQPIDTYSCNIVEFRSCDDLMVSVKELPKLIATRYGVSIQSLYSIDRMAEFKQISLQQYRLNKRRQPDYNEDVFMVIDNKIYLPNSTVRSLTAYILALDGYDLNEMSDCTEGCKSAWDYEFIATSDILEDVISATIQNFSVTLSIPEDEAPNLNQNMK